MKVFRLIATLLTAILMVGLGSGIAHANGKPLTDTSNSYRNSIGFPSLPEHAELNRIAQNKANQLASADNGLSHADFGSIQSPRGRLVGEGNGISEIFGVWKTTQKSKETLHMDGYTHVGSGVAVASSGRYYAVQMFGYFPPPAPAPAPVPEPQPVPVQTVQPQPAPAPIPEPQPVPVIPEPEPEPEPVVPEPEPTKEVVVETPKPKPTPTPSPTKEEVVETPEPTATPTPTPSPTPTPTVVEDEIQVEQPEPQDEEPEVVEPVIPNSGFGYAGLVAGGGFLTTFFLRRRLLSYPPTLE